MTHQWAAGLPVELSADTTVWKQVVSFSFSQLDVIIDSYSQ